MGSWDCDCAICAGPLALGNPLADQPRTARFFRRHPEARLSEQDGSLDIEDGDDNNDDDESDAVQDEERSFDPDILTHQDFEWMNTLHVLSYKEEEDCAPKSRRGFISGPGRYIDSAMVTVEPGDDANFDPNAEIICYDGAFPFHWPCYQLFCRAFGRDGGLSAAEKNTLFWAMVHLQPSFHPRLCKLDHREPCFPEEQWWNPIAGLELLVTNPMDSTGVADLVKTTILSTPPPLQGPFDLSQRVKNDPFQKLPSELIQKIASSLPTDSLLALLNASWIVNDNTLSDNTFWKRYMRISMPWFFELLQLLDTRSQEGKVNSEAMDLKNRDYKKLFLQLNKVTEPRKFMRGPWMRLANRRRIWYLCEQLVAEYHIMTQRPMFR